MTNLTSVGVTAGVPTSGTGTVSTIDNIPTLLGTVKAASTAPIATDPALVTSLSPNSAGIVALGQSTKTGSVPVTLASDQGSIGAFSSQYPSGAIPITATATGTTAATVATLAGTVGKTTYITGFTITSDATALAVGTAVVSGIISGSLSYLQNILAVTSGASNLTQAFNPAIPASATNTAIVVTSAAAGTGGNTIVNAQGYQL